MAKPLTEAQAWRKAAKDVMVKENQAVEGDGLCWILDCMEMDGDISHTIFRRMRERIYNYAVAHGIDVCDCGCHTTYDYIWSLDKNGRTSRVRFALKQARLLEK